MDGKWWKVLIFLVLGFSSYGQYVYTYTDPCTGILNSVTIYQPSGSVTLFYAGQYNTFTQAQLQAGAFELWVQTVNATAPPGLTPALEQEELSPQDQMHLLVLIQPLTSQAS